MENMYKYMQVKGTVGVNSSDPPFVEWHTSFTIVPLKPLTDGLIQTYIQTFSKSERK